MKVASSLLLLNEAGSIETQKRESGDRYRADIDGLRALAVVLVVAFHAFPGVVHGGFIGVDVFFVISGYLISGNIFSSINSGTFTLAGFYIRRARRILPALAVMIAGTLAIGWAVLSLSAYEALGLHALAGTLFFPNFVFWNEVGYFDPAAETKPLLHLWSLGVEEQFYLAWPILLVVLSKRPKILAPSLCAIVSVSLIYSCYATILFASCGLLFSLLAIVGTWHRRHPLPNCQPSLQQQPIVVRRDSADCSKRAITQEDDRVSRSVCHRPGRRDYARHRLGLDPTRS